ncbi:hypothetical protein vseg_015989 [Gypsophila vaccaria]
MKKKVLNAGYFLFDSKPMIVKEWTAEMEMKKTDVLSVPTWIQLHQLPLKFWGKSLPKIAGLVGKYIHSDSATEHKTKLGFARVLVEVEVDQQFPDHISFRDEVGQVMKIAVEYEWKPITCSKCHKMGHATEDCRKDQANKPKVKPPQKVWMPVKKPVEALPQPVAQEVQTIRSAEKGTPMMAGRPGSSEEHGGYTNLSFGAVSYRDIVSPTGHVQNGKPISLNVSNG